jgi:hypothetical protein
MGLAIGQAPIKAGSTPTRQPIESDDGLRPPTSTVKGKKKDIGYGRIIRDDDGNIVSVEEDVLEEARNPSEPTAPRLPGELAMEDVQDRNVLAGAYATNSSDVVRGALSPQLVGA